MPHSFCLFNLPRSLPFSIPPHVAIIPIRERWFSPKSCTIARLFSILPTLRQPPQHLQGQKECETSEIEISLSIKALGLDAGLIAIVMVVGLFAFYFRFDTVKTVDSIYHVTVQSVYMKAVHYAFTKLPIKRTKINLGKKQRA